MRLLWLRKAILWLLGLRKDFIGVLHRQKNDRNVQNDHRFFDYVRHVLRFKPEFNIFPKPVCFASSLHQQEFKQKNQSFHENLCVHQNFSSFYNCQKKLPNCSYWRKMSSDEVLYWLFFSLTSISLIQQRQMNGKSWMISGRSLWFAKQWNHKGNGHTIIKS